jgi:hypothetical protein
LSELPETSVSDDLDGAWKEALDRFFEPFMALMFPEAHADIDWSLGYESLDSELQQVVRDAELGRRLADKLVRVWRRGGAEIWVLVHLEVQGQPDPEFPERMYVYNYRIYDRYRHHVASMAVLADTRPDWRPSEFGYEIWGCRPGLRFPVVKLLDWEPRWADLEVSANPFAVIVMAHLRALATRRKPETRLQWKLHLARALYRSGLRREDVLELFRFIDWILALPPELERGFDQTIRVELEANKMPYITRWEREGLERGLQQGLQQGLEQGKLDGLRLALEATLRFRFETTPDDIAAGIALIDETEALCMLHRTALTCSDLDSFRAALARYTAA